MEQIVVVFFLKKQYNLKQQITDRRATDIKLSPNAFPDMRLSGKLKPQGKWRYADA